MPEKPTIQFEQLTVLAGEAYAQGRQAAACAIWHDAAAAADHLAVGDPRRAAARNNVAVAHWLGGDARVAVDALRQAIELWRHSTAMLETATLRSPARSSLFHLRLEQQHRPAFDRLRRQDCARLLDAAAAVSVANKVLIAHGNARTLTLTDAARALVGRAADHSDFAQALAAAATLTVALKE